MRAIVACAFVVACGEPSSPPPTAPTATASLDVPPLPAPKPSADKPAVRQAPPPTAADTPDDESPLPNDPAASEAAFADAKRAMANGDLVKARALFLRSLRLDYAVGSLLNLAECERKLGDKPNALRHYQAAYDEAIKQGYKDRAAIAKARIDELKQGP